MKKILLFFTLAASTAFAQITINSSDLAGQFAVGNSVVIKDDTLLTSVDIGSPGGGNNWDFSMLQSHLMIDLTSVEPSGTPFISDYPGANYCTYSIGTLAGITSEIYSYLTLNGTLESMGYASTASTLPGFENKIFNSPAEIQIQFPYTLNSTWTQSYTQEINSYFNGTLVNSINSNVSKTVLVDAYGTMTLPGGGTFEALRQRTETNITTTMGMITSVGYTYITKSGAQVSFPAIDINPPNSGVINVDGGSWNSPLTSDIHQISGLPEEYTLKQNYPNPFNPTTNIEYSIPEASFVELKVYDVLGNEIVTLVSQEQAAGVYRADFNAVGLTSGFYIARISAGNYSDAIKMTLMK